ncbi:uncharacterized protein B0H18DRAFT_1046284 [Fomitopsis serialis]|uniref:uncharacterized protein n=1 Tax=Fomitopsis serialis TaxID=139415 RepID=UPI002008A389|nr:uncharacterized protein B0H18DRAFT_1046284 [Neoantrodia serialis]KAH9914266.1 hypothetical protein B0H18DRAFT_1046284 [Neoantrodia serialis]
MTSRPPTTHRTRRLICLLAHCLAHSLTLARPPVSAPSAWLLYLPTHWTVVFNSRLTTTATTNYHGRPPRVKAPAPSPGHTETNAEGGDRGWVEHEA